jgi:copper oxidase (laccase) domain-containing protein
MSLQIYTSKISDGSMKPIIEDDFEQVFQNRSTFLLDNNIQPDNTTLVRVKYNGNNYYRYTEANNNNRGEGIVRDSNIICDALVTTNPNHALFLPLADCVGAVLYDPSRNILMVSHLGRHSLEQFGGKLSVEYLQKQYSLEPKNITVWLSPAAGKLNYPLFAFNNRSLHEVAIEQLTNAGILIENIDISPIDPTTDEYYYSHSKFLKGNQTTDGRFAIIATMIN